MIKTLILLASGVVLLVLSFPPVDLGWLAFVALVPIVVAIHTAEQKKIYLYAWIAGVGLFMASCAWLSEPAFVNLVAMALPQGLVLPLFALFYRFGKRRAGLPVWACVPVGWIAAEFIRATFPLDGFPWLLLGYTSWRMGPLLQTADLFGVWGPGFIMALFSGVVAGYLIHLRARPWPQLKPIHHAGAVFWVVLMAAALIYGSARPGAITLEKGPVVATVQGNIPQDLKNNPQSPWIILDRYVSGTQRLFREGAAPMPELVVWPETMYPVTISEGIEGEIWEPVRRVGDREARELEKQHLVDPVVKGITGPAGAWFLVGALTYRLGPDGEPEKRNSAILYDPEGSRVSTYAKSILVPGGEYLPWIDVVPFAEAIKSFVLSVAPFLPDLTPGDGVGLHTMETGTGRYVFGIHICFENIYGDYNRKFVRQGAHFMINMSNEGWFKDSAEFDQMMAMSLFRAVETRRSLFRSTNTGISCLVDPLGTLPAQGTIIVAGGRDREVEGVLAVEVPLCSEKTLFSEIGDLFPRILLLAQLAILAFSILRGLRLQKTAAAIEEVEKK